MKIEFIIGVMSQIQRTRNVVTIEAEQVETDLTPFKEYEPFINWTLCYQFKSLQKNFMATTFL